MEPKESKKRRNKTIADFEGLYVVLEEEELAPGIISFPPNYDRWQGIVRSSQWEGEDIGERLTDDPTYIDRI